MKILIDARVISDKMHGIARYAYNLIKNLAEIDTENEYILLSGYEELRDFCSRYKNFRFVRCNTPLYSIQEQFIIPLILKREKVDIYHSPTFSAPIYQPCRVIITLYDMMHFVFGKFIHKLYYKYLLKRAIVKALCIVTISEYSKMDIVKWLGIPQDKIYVRYCGIEERFKPSDNTTVPDEIKNKYGISGQYILFVGNPKPHKNLNGTVKAFKIAAENGGLKHSLVVVGIEGRAADDLNDKVIFIKSCNDDDLIKLYQSADLFLAPSLYEGFGLPILEAMACGVPVITSDRTSIPEVVGDAAIMVNPEDIDEIANAVCRVLKDENLKGDLIRKGLERAKMFSWRKMAEETIKLYMRVSM
jgi:glycosyltransferase involved in cell wall biosynthesis